MSFLNRKENCTKFDYYFSFKLTRSTLNKQKDWNFLKKTDEIIRFVSKNIRHRRVSNEWVDGPFFDRFEYIDERIWSRRKKSSRYEIAQQINDEIFLKTKKKKLTKFERKSVESFSRCCLVRELGATARRLFYHFFVGRWSLQWEEMLTSFSLNRGKKYISIFEWLADTSCPQLNVFQFARVSVTTFTCLRGGCGDDPLG